MSDEKKEDLVPVVIKSRADIKARAHIRKMKNDGFVIVSSIQGAIIGIENLYEKFEGKMTDEESAFLEERLNYLIQLGQDFNNIFDLKVNM